jgi:hypothetical protein
VDFFPLSERYSKTSESSFLADIFSTLAPTALLILHEYHRIPYFFHTDSTLCHGEEEVISDHLEEEYPFPLEVLSMIPHGVST